MKSLAIGLETQWRGQYGRVLRAGFVSLMAMVSALSLIGGGAFSQEARAATVVTGQAGWAGNQVIYMTTGMLSGNAYVIPTMTGYYQTGTLSQEGNAVSLLVGQDAKTPSSDLVFHEYYDPNANAMLVWVPVALGGSSPMAFNGIVFVPAVSYNEQAISASSSPSSAISILNVYNSGINVTGPNEVGTTQSDALKNGGIDTLAVISKTFGAAVAPFQIMYDLEALSGVFSYKTGASGNDQVYQYFGTSGGSIGNGLDQDVFVSQTYDLITIPYSEFTTTPHFTVSGYNELAPFNTVSASTSVTILAYPAVTLSGQVKAAGLGLPGAIVNIEPTSGSQSGTIFQVNGDANGNWRFFGQINTPYLVWSTFSNAFGSASSPQTQVPADSSPTSTSPVTLTIPASSVYGTTSCSGCPSAPQVVLTNTATNAQVATFSSGASAGSYRIWTPTTGAYKIFAGVGYYSSPTYSINVAVMGQSYSQSLTLTKSSSGCVLAGTDITTPNGQKRVEQLSQGDAILGYNVTSGTWVKETVTSNTATKVSAVLSIDSGLLETTLTDQPLYVRNGTWTGWVHDPQNLSVGEQILDPLTGGWVTITSLRNLQGTFTVYDLRVTTLNDFVANGLLALDKVA